MYVFYYPLPFLSGKEDLRLLEMEEEHDRLEEQHRLEEQSEKSSRRKTHAKR